MIYAMMQYIIIAGAEAMKKAEKELLAYRQAATDGIASRGSTGSHGRKHMGDHYQPINNTLSSS